MHFSLSCASSHILQPQASRRCARCRRCVPVPGFSVHPCCPHACQMLRTSLPDRGLSSCCKVTVCGQCVCSCKISGASDICNIVCVCVCVCVCVWSVPKLVVLISNPAAFAAINQIDGPATILIACVLYHYCSKSATIAIFRPTWSVNHTLVAAPRLERKPTKSRRHHQR